MQISAHVKNGIIVPDIPVNLPEGAPVLVVHEENASAHADAVREAAAKRLEELIAEAKERTILPDRLTPEEAARRKQGILEIFRVMENDPPVSLESLDREFLYADNRSE